MYILVNAFFTTLFCWMPYQLLVEFGVLILALSMFFFLFSFLYLRVRRQDLTRPFQAPGGLPMACILALMPLIVTCANVYLSASSGEEGTQSFSECGA